MQLDNRFEKIEQVLERIEDIFSEIREIVYSLRSEEERSHREREKMHYEMLEELRMIRKTLENILTEILEVKGKIGLS